MPESFGYIEEGSFKELSRELRRVKHKPDNRIEPDKPARVPYYLELFGTLDATLHSTADSTGAFASVWAPHDDHEPRDTQRTVRVYPWFLPEGQSLLEDTKITVGSFGGRLFVTNPRHIPGWFELKDNLPSSGSVSDGQSATAYLVNSAGVVDTDVEFEVFDELGIYRGRGKDVFSSPNAQGSRGEARWDHVRGRLIIENMEPHALRISGTAGADVYFDTTQFTLSGTPVIMSPSGALSMDGDYTGVNLIKNPLGLQFASGGELHAEWNEDAVQWESVDGDVPRPHRISGVTSGSVATSDSTFTLSGSPVIMGPIGAISEEDYTASNLIYNPFGFKIDNGGLIHAEYNEDSGHWECIQAECPA